MEELIFPFNNCGALSVQSDQHCQELYDDFYQVLEQDAAKFLEDAGALVCQVKKLKETRNITWKARYGCAILVHDVDVVTKSITVVGLDNWKTIVHSSEKGREATAEPDLTENAAIFPVGCIRSDKVEKVLETALRALRKTENTTTSDKNHKTPSFVYARLLDALVSLELLPSDEVSTKRECYQGGSTDVGLHSGCLRRNTTFPLVASVYSVMLCLDGDCHRNSFYQSLCIYFVYHLSKIVSDIQMHDPRRIDRGIIVIREIRRYLFLVKDTEFHDRIVKVMRSNHRVLTNMKPAVDETKTKMPRFISIQESCKQVEPGSFPCIPIADESSDDNGSRVARAREEAKKNLQWSELKFYDSKSATVQDSWVAFGRINSLFWGYAKELKRQDSNYTVAFLKELLQKHAHATSAVAKASETCVHVMKKELKSCHTLVVWITYCWSHRIANEVWPLFKDYSAVLDPRDLSYLVLSDSEAIVAVGNVRDFLELHRTKQRFPFLRPQDTLVLSLAVGQNSEAIRKQFAAEQAYTERIISERYRQIEKAQRELNDLDRQLSDANLKLSEAKRETLISESRDYVYSRDLRIIYTSAYREFQRKEKAARDVVSGLEREITCLEKPPPDVFMALPKCQNTALQWLFFLYMPVEFANVLSLAHLGETHLWSKLPTAIAPKQNLASWFSTYNKIHRTLVLLPEMTLGSNSSAVEHPLAKGLTIRQYGIETGVFFPDKFAISPFWRGTDPFSGGRKDNDTARLFTENLPAGVDSRIQDFLVLLRDPSPSRGNLGVATKNRRPGWLSQEEYLSFASLRAFPNLQLRQLLVVMADNLLPFDHECVHILVKQLLYQVGFENWKTDVAMFNIYKHMADELDSKAVLLKESPNNNGQLLLFGIMSSFFGQFDPVLLDYSRRYASISRSLADQIGQEVRNVETVSPHIYWKQAQLYGCALLSISIGDTSASSLLDMVELIVLFKNKSLFAAEDRRSGELNEAIQCCMAKKISCILKVLSSNLNHLTKCLLLIVSAVQPGLKWVPICYGPVVGIACFEAQQGDHLYSINVLNGTVLVDGVPPGFLPSSIVLDPLYRRTFGSRNFECVVVGVSCFRTCRLVDDRFIYEFKQHDGQLLITECDRGHYGMSADKNSSRLRLLKRDILDVPILLSKPYSHWYSDALQTIFVRSPSYKSRNIHFTMTKKGTYRVPVEYGSLPIEAVCGSISNYERLVFSPPQVLEVLTRVEDSRYILVWVDAHFSKIRYSLPRVDLEFSQVSESVESVNYSGFTLRESQNLSDTLRGVTSYLILVDVHSREKIVIPSGSVDDKGNVTLPEHWNFKSQCHIYDVHERFGNLIAKDDVGRLQLACTYAATSCLLVDEQLKMNGMMIAMELARHCWTNETMPGLVKEKLVELSKRSNLSCSLQLLCSWVWKCSNQLHFLQEKCDTRSQSDLRLELDPLAVREYRSNEYPARLLRDEELFLIGSQQQNVTQTEVEEPCVSKTREFVYGIETTIHRDCLVPMIQNPTRDSKVFPLDLPANANGSDKQIRDDLLESWNTFCSLEQSDVHYNKLAFDKMVADVKIKRCVAEGEMLSTLNENDSNEFVVALLSGAIRPASARDLLRLVLDDSIIQEINPFLTTNTCMGLRTKSVEWMMLCVLDDKLHRVLRSSTKHEVLEEVKTIRRWDPWIHVRWLAFEVEQGLQIRPYQYYVVQQLLNSPRSMIQLNMGLGKTSVLVPMLILELTKSKTDIVRINMLASIINVVKEIYRLTLTASVHHVKVLTMPFQRDFPLDSDHAMLLSEVLLRCKDGRSCLLVTPQHRNSLTLKQYDQDVHVCGLKESFVDIIDESDAVLHQSFQLVYALGDQEYLPDGEIRWTMIEAFLQLFAESKSRDISLARSDSEAVHCEDCAPGEFQRLRLLPGFEKHREAVALALCTELVTNPHHDCLWMKRVSAAKIPLLVKIMSDSQISVLKHIESDPVFREYTSDILAARGCIAYGLLFHCLRARHRVNYGIDHSRKRLAVPFFASDTPKDRAEFSHPDIPLLYTCLSYFHDGLDENQLKEALTCLGTLGPTAQQTIYSSWIESIRGGPANTTDLTKFDSYLKVDLDDIAQLTLLHRSLHRCMKLISFWMNNCVFPMETHVFPQRRVTSAWNLVDKDNAVGFSGTDDNRFLLPRFVKQKEQEVPELRATNGEMIDRILKCTKKVVLLDDRGLLWKTILQECANRRLSCLIDVGGLMAGVPNRDAATILGDSIDQEKFRGVVYYETASKAWNVFELKSKLYHPLTISSLQASECFAYYDESRCRGSDLKLKTDACALVTLEPALTKDRFLQGCARMRKLRPGAQSLVLAGTSEVLQSSRTAKNVLELTIHNSARAVQKGVVEFFDRGMDHTKFPAAQQIDVSLKYLYSKPVLRYSSLSGYLDAEIEKDAPLSVQQEKEREQLVQHCKRIGGSTSVQVSQLSEEVERELEDEEEEEEEEEKEVETANPYSEKNWNFGAVFSSGIITGIHVQKVKDVIGELLGPPVGDIKWSQQLFCTENWRNTITSMAKSGRSYLRPVNSFLSLTGGKVVLISEYEADELLPYWWQTHSPQALIPPQAILGHLSLNVYNIRLDTTRAQLPLEVLTAAKLFRGYVSFDKEEQKILREMFAQTPQPRTAIIELLQLRQRVRFLDRSDLDIFSLVAKAN